MSIPTDGAADLSFESGTHEQVPSRPVRPLYWSIRREIWENRSIILAPLIVAAVVLFATLMVSMSLPKKVRTLPTLEPAKRHQALVGPLHMAPAPIMMATFLVGMFYALDALYGERRERSILFWKSLPVSDRTAVLAKAAIPLVVLPVIAWVLSVLTQVVLLFAGTAILAGSRISPAILWREFGFLPGLVIMFYGLAVHTLWFSPIYGWLLLVSAWARRAPLLWAVLPLLGVVAVERIVLQTTLFGQLLQYRFTGAMKAAFALEKNHSGDIDRLSQLRLGNFLMTPGLWLGLAFAAACLVAAVRLRRRREPI